MNPLMQIRDLRVEFGNHVTILNGVNLDVFQGETLGLVGESGCGKTTLGRCAVRLLAPSGGQINFDGREIANLSAAELRPLRKAMQLVFQNPFTSLNPRMKVLDLISEPLLTHTNLGKTERR
ncbi:MAG TPA: ATP-binding cassette domain-containing protein, partial [Phototrophicaceae bacterium]|nr:ATP-binding cassette domain-containing protein [Phototrophicaceae bacterium]